MKFLSRFFRRKPEAMPTASEGLKIIEGACDKTLKQGLEGFVIAMVSAPDDKGSHVLVSLNGAVGTGLAAVLAMMLSKPDTKHMTTVAIAAALSESGAATVVMPDDNCQCPVCTARRADEKSSQTTTTH